MEFQFLNGWERFDTIIFPVLSFGLFISKLCIFYVGYEYDESYPTFLIVVLNFGFEFNFTK